jgi:hypothetical protein
MSVGTFVATGLVRAFRRESRAVDALKPVVTGFDALAAESGDLAHLIAAWDGPLGADALAESKSPTPRWFPSLSSSFVVGRQRPPETGVPSWAREIIAHYLVELITYFASRAGAPSANPVAGVCQWSEFVFTGISRKRPSPSRRSQAATRNAIGAATPIC